MIRENRFETDRVVSKTAKGGKNPLSEAHRAFGAAREAEQKTRESAASSSQVMLNGNLLIVPHIHTSRLGGCAFCRNCACHSIGISKFDPPPTRPPRTQEFGFTLATGKVAVPVQPSARRGRVIGATVAHARDTDPSMLMQRTSHDIGIEQTFSPPKAERPWETWRGDRKAKETWLDRRPRSVEYLR